MPKTTARLRPERRSAHEPWMSRAGGWDALSDAHRRSAETSYGRWTDGRPDRASRYGRDDYVDYVQRQHADRREQEAAQAETSPAPAPAAVRPDEAGARTDERVSQHAVAALSGTVPPVPGPGWSARLDRDVVSWRTPTGGSIADHGDRLVPSDGTDPSDVVRLARSKG